MKAKRITKILIAVSIAAILVMPSAHIQNPFVSPANANNAVNLTQLQQKLLSGFASFELLNLATSDVNLHKDPASYFPSGDDACSSKVHDNVKVNQNCLNLSDSSLQGRGQAQNEPAIAQDPNQPNHIVAAYNDYRRGDGTCGTSYSLDGGKTWSDSTVPNGFTSGGAFGGVAREYWQAGGDTSVAWDTKGNAYLDCQVFQRGLGTTNNHDFSSGIYIMRSTQNFGASWNFAAHPVVVDFDTTGATLLDKPYMTVDNNPGSSFQDRIYVSWTIFAADGSAYIMESHSSDYGQTFSAPVTVNNGGATLCPVTFGVPTPNGNCNENQDSQPMAGPDGALYVVYNNYNNAVSGSDNHNQILLSKSTDGGVTFSAPIKVADFYDLPDCATYQAGQDAGRACVPEKGSSTNSVFRANNYPSGAVDPTDPSHVVVSFGSYINAFSNEGNGCVPAGFAASGQNIFTGVKTAGACSNKILVSVSTNGGASFTGTTTDPRSLPTANQDKGQATTDQWWQWAAFQSHGSFVVSYYDRQYGSDETTGSMDFSLSISGHKPDSFNVQRVTSTSMPLPTEFPNGLGNSVFIGDYTGLSSAGNTAHPIWSDTRNSDLFLCPGTGTTTVPPAVCNGIEPNGLAANDEDVFTSSLGV